MNVFYFPPKNSICFENGHKKCDSTALTTYFYIVRAVLLLKFETIYRIERYICNPIFLLIIIHRDAIGLLGLVVCHKLAQALCLEDYAFYGCHSLKEINIPNKVSTIGESAFYRCDALEKIDLSQCDKLKKLKKKIIIYIVIFWIILLVLMFIYESTK